MKRFLILYCMILLAAACGPAAEVRVQTLPTLAVMETPPALPLEGAERVAREFMAAWAADDYTKLYGMISFASQESTTLDAFVRLYQSTADEMTLEGLDYTGNALSPDSSRYDVVTFNYDLTFKTRLLGEFSDRGRNLQLVVDARAADWRVAWSAADIFPEMIGGGRLRLEISPPSRANIYDRDDLVLADQNGRVVVVRAVKQEIADWPACLALVAPLVEKQPETVQRTYDESAADWLIELGTLEASRYEANNAQLTATCAAQFSSRPARRYPNGTIAPNVVGTVGFPDEAELPAVEAEGFNSDTIVGKSGIEKSWDEQLRGHPGGRLVIVTPGGGILREIARATSSPAESVWLTLDSDLQTAITRIFAEAYEKNGYAQSKGAAAVVMDVHTGDILAMVSYPTYDANVFAPYPAVGRIEAARIVAQLQTDIRRPLINRAAQGLYPLGSVFKTISAIAVADTGVYTLDQRYTCGGIWSRDINRYDWLAGGHGTLTLPQSITQSCNPYYYEVGYQINQYDPFALPTYAKRLGMGTPTGLTDITEASGLIIDPDWKLRNLGYEWTFSDAVNMAIGQGEVQVTPLQVTRMFAAFANGGTLYRPNLVQKVGILGEAPSFVNAPEPVTNINIRPEVLDTLRSGLCAVTQSQSGTAEYQFRNTRLQSIGVCGKTGTAQDGSRPDSISHAWFAAYAPMDNPEVAIAVLVENSGEGSGVAAPIVRDILLYYFFGQQ